MKLEVIRGDITKCKVDIIVNAANSSLLGGGGVDGAIHRAGGPEILEACRVIRRRQGSCKTGEAVITTAGKLPAKNVVHTVGPVWNGGEMGEAHKLAGCYTNALRLAEEQHATSIAFPNISTGIYRYPKTSAAEIAINTVKAFAADFVEEVLFVCFDEENFQLYRELLSSDEGNV